MNVTIGVHRSLTNRKIDRGMRRLYKEIFGQRPI